MCVCVCVRVCVCVCVCVNDSLGISGSLLCATYVSVNRPADLQRGAKFCPSLIYDLREHSFSRTAI